MKKSFFYVAPDTEWSVLTQEKLICTSPDSDNESYQYDDTFNW